MKLEHELGMTKNRTYWQEISIGSLDLGSNSVPDMKQIEYRNIQETSLYEGKAQATEYQNCFGFCMSVQTKIALVRHMIGQKISLEKVPLS